MRGTVTLLAVFALSGALSCELPVPGLMVTALRAQTPAVPVTAATYRFANPPATPQAYQEAATVIRTVAEVRDVSIDSESARIGFSGQADSLSMAQWLLAGLDRAPGAQPPAGTAPAGNSGDSLRIFDLTRTTSLRGMQWTLTTLRSVADIQRAFSYTPLHAIALRGTAAEIAMSAWLIGQIDRPDGPVASPPADYRATDSATDLVRVYYLANAIGVSDFNRILTAVRVTGGIMKCLGRADIGALVLRGTQAEVDRAGAIAVAMDAQLAPAR